MRETIHLVSRADYALFAAGIRTSNREWRLRVDKRKDDRKVAALAGKLRKHLRGRTITRKELAAFVGGEPGVGHWVELVRVPPAGTWEQRGAHTYGLAEEWVGALDATEDDGIEHLARRYLGGFGPARIDDVASWSKVPKTRLAPVLERMKLRRFRDEQGKELLDLPRAPLPDPDTPAPVRFLPTWDATLLVHARRTLILPEEYRPILFSTKMPPSYPTFLVDGAVIGNVALREGARRAEAVQAPLTRRAPRAGRGSGAAGRVSRVATTIPARHPGARPPSGGRIRSAPSPHCASSHEIKEFEFHISPARSSSRPHTGSGTDGTRSSRRRATAGSSVSRRGLSTASATSGMTPSRQRRIS